MYRNSWKAPLGSSWVCSCFSYLEIKYTYFQFDIPALVNIGLASYDLSRTSDPDQKALDSLNIISGSFSLIAIGAGWASSTPDLPALGLAGEVDESAASAVVAATDTSILEGVGAVSGPLAIVFALGE
jgi:hypothetical protein